MSGMLRDRKTPGVYVTELTAFPPSAVGIETAVPAFVGYTERADIRGRAVFETPVRIGSLADYHEVFGGAPNTLFRFEQATEDDIARRDYDVEYEAFPGEGQKAEQGEPVRKKLVAFGQVGLLYRSLALFYANGGAACYVVSVGRYGETVDADALKAGVMALQDQVGPTMLVVPDLSLLPREGVNVLGFRDVAVAMLNQCRDKQDRVALFDVVHAQHIGPKPAPGALEEAIAQFRADVDHDYRDYGIAYFPDLHTSTVSPNDIKYTAFERSGFVEFLLNEATKLFPNPRSPEVQTLVETLRQQYREGVPAKAAARKEAEGHLQEGLKLLRETNPAGARKLEFLVTDPRPEDLPGNEEAITSRDQNLTHAFPALTQLDALAARRLNRLPACGAIAGVMTTIDATRGVWNAPANIALNGVLQAALHITNDQQGDLNKPIDGKAINVIREFAGRGLVVWGARTLDGNSNDHRYVQVRRTLIYIEQSVKAALNPFVFAPNDGNTWVAVTSMISNFLHDLWARGGLMGATPQQAYSVDCGLGTTMTGRDVLEGYMVVQVLVQLVHPAEFIELTFKQKMEGVG